MAQTFKYDCIYIRKWGSSGDYTELPYKIDGVNTLPEYDASQNDVDLDAYTNTKGYTVRNRVRHDVKSLDFNIPTMTGQELKDFFSLTKDVWLDVKFFDESDWNWVSKKMYRSGTVSYHKYLIDTTDPLKNIYQDITFNFVEQ